MNRRKKIKIISFSVTALCALIIWGGTGTVKAKNAEKEILLMNERAITELCEYMDSIETSLTKTMYASSGNLLSELTVQLQRDCSGAKESLSSLTPGETELYNTYKFLTQAGHFTAAINKKTAEGETLTDEERRTLEALKGFASSLSSGFSYMSSLMSERYLSFEELENAAAAAEEGSEKMVSYMDSIGNAETALKDFPTLIYDGPFSDNIMNRESALLAEAHEITEDEARKIAAAAIGTEEKYLVSDSPSGGKTPAYNFCDEKYNISVTKNGGYILEIISSPELGAEKLTAEEASAAAADFLETCGYYDMSPSYYYCSGGICTANFSYKQGSFLCYPDLIKVSVTLDKGEICGFEAKDYIMNHKKREIPAFGISPREAAENVSSMLSVKKVSAAVIPTPSGNEKYTYELLCTDGTRDILIYKNITSGEEEDVLLLIYADDGTLTR